MTVAAKLLAIIQSRGLKLRLYEPCDLVLVAPSGKAEEATPALKESVLEFKDELIELANLKAVPKRTKPAKEEPKPPTEEPKKKSDADAWGPDICGRRKSAPERTDERPPVHVDVGGSRDVVLRERASTALIDDLRRSLDGVNVTDDFLRGMALAAGQMNPVANIIAIKAARQLELAGKQKVLTRELSDLIDRKQDWQTTADELEDVLIELVQLQT